MILTLKQGDLAFVEKQKHLSQQQLFSPPPCLWPAQLRNLGIKIISGFPSRKYDKGNHVQFPTRKLIFYGGGVTGCCANTTIYMLSMI